MALGAFRMGRVLRSSLSGNTLMMQPSSTWFRASFRTRCMDLLIRNVPMPSAASKSAARGSDLRSRPLAVRYQREDCQKGCSSMPSRAPAFPHCPDDEPCVDFWGCPRTDFNQDAHLHAYRERCCTQQPMNPVIVAAANRRFGWSVPAFPRYTNRRAFCSRSYRGFPRGSF